MSEGTADDAGANSGGEVPPDRDPPGVTESHASDLKNRRLPSGRSRLAYVSVWLSAVALVIAGMSAWFTWRQAAEAGRQADEAKRQADAAQYANELADSDTARKIRVESSGDLDSAVIVDNQSDQLAESMWLEGENSAVKVTIDLYDLKPCRRLSSNASSTIGLFLKEPSLHGLDVAFH